MKILFIVPYAPTPIRVRPYQLVRTLAEQGHEITLATLWTTDAERVDLAQIAPYCASVVAHHLSRWRALSNVLQSAWTSKPLQSAYCRQPELARSLATLLRTQHFDVVHVEHLRGAHYGLAAQGLLGKAASKTPVVWDSVDCITHLFEQAVQHSRNLRGRLITQLDLARTRRYEGWLVGQFNRVFVTSTVEKRALMRLCPLGEMVDDQVTVIANGVDLEYFAPQSGTRSETGLVFSGKMSYHANVTAALFLVHEIMPRVWEQRPEVTLAIVGAEPPAEIRALATAGEARRVTVTGTVPDMRPYLRNATLAVAPIVYGAGVQNKLLEAMACGTPVVTTPLAASGLHAQATTTMAVGEGAEQLAATILHLLSDQPARMALGQRGRRYVEEYHTWSNVATQLGRAYQECAAGAGAVPKSVQRNYYAYSH
jgi:sugar transferase (PEP-CTERM/EpsH1 system associated)